MGKKNSYQITFEGNFLEFFIKFLGLILLGFFTLGVSWLYIPYWFVEYFTDKISIEIKE